MAANTRPALFIDRDGTLIRDEHYLKDPARVVLQPGAVELLRRFRDAGFALVVITNQSGIARGLLTEADYEAVRTRLGALLAANGVTLDLTLHCPHHPDFGRHCACRKPGTMLFERARDLLGLDLKRSLFVGDRWRDVAPALGLGGEGVLLVGIDTPREEIERVAPNVRVVKGLDEVAPIAPTAG